MRRGSILLMEVRPVLGFSIVIAVAHNDGISLALRNATVGVMRTSLPSRKSVSSLFRLRLRNRDDNDLCASNQGAKDTQHSVPHMTQTFLVM